MLKEEPTAATHHGIASGGAGQIDRVKAGLVLAATVASLLVALVAARSFFLLAS